MSSLYLSSMALAFWALVLVETVRSSDALGAAYQVFLAVELALVAFHGLYMTCELKRLRALEKANHFHPDRNTVSGK